MTARFICIGTHHKTGTIWMRKVFRAISDQQGIPFMPVYQAQRLADAADTGPQIIVNWASSFPRELIDMDHARFLHIIRDPRDVLLSGMRYHRIAPLKNEKFLTETKPEWRNMSYQDYLNTLPDNNARLMFEMENKHEQTLKEMLRWPQTNAGATDRTTDIKYEDLIEDTDCQLFRGTLERFNIEGLNIGKAMQSYWANSLFGGLSKENNRTDRVALHVASGKKAQWMEKLPREIAEPYADRYAGALKVLGYAENSDWVNDCLPARDIAA